MEYYAGEQPPETVSMRLKCGKCGHEASYKLTRIFIRPEIRKAKSAEALTRRVSFGDYFRCKKCASAWPWELTSEAYLELSALMLTHIGGKKDERLVFALPQLFDGSPVYSLAQAEEYLLAILQREPDNSFVWSRLGNIYEKAGLIEKAAQAFTRALELNPQDLESIRVEFPAACGVECFA